MKGETMKQPHILCTSDDVADRVLLPGDPARVLRVAEHLEDVREIAFNREFRTVSGIYDGVTVTVTSTGIGGASAVIALEELTACGARAFVRIGSAGACRAGIGLGDLVIPVAAVREEGASRMYVPEGYPAVADHDLVGLLTEACDRHGFPRHRGIVRSHDSFYIDDEEERVASWGARGVLASDMETATLLTLATLRGVRAAAVLNNVVLFGGDVKEGIGDYVDEEAAAAEGEKREILVALEALTGLEI